MFSILDAAAQVCIPVDHIQSIVLIQITLTGCILDVQVCYSLLIRWEGPINLYYHYIPSSIHVNQSIESTNSGMMQELYYVIDNINGNVFQLTAFEDYTLHPPISSPLGYLHRFQHCTCHRATSTSNMEAGFWAIFSQAYKIHDSRWQLFHTWQHWRHVLQWSFRLCRSGPLGWSSWQDFSLTGDQVHLGFWPSTRHSSS